MSKRMSKRITEERCWCGHLRRWHGEAGVCRWCAKMELRHPRFNFMPRHAFATEVPEELRRRFNEAMGRAFRELSDQTELPGNDEP